MMIVTGLEMSGTGNESAIKGAKLFLTLRRPNLVGILILHSSFLGQSCVVLAVTKLFYFPFSNHLVLSFLKFLKILQQTSAMSTFSHVMCRANIFLKVYCFKPI